MKKLYVVIMTAALAMFLLTASAAVEEEPKVSELRITVNGVRVESEYREYPILEYRGKVYLPLTYYDARFMGLVTDWDREAGLVTVYQSNVAGMYRPYSRETANPASVDAKVYNGDVRLVNKFASDSVTDRLIKNSDQNPPLLTFRNITYIPLTEPYTAVLELKCEFAGDSLDIVSNNYHPEEVKLYNYVGGAAAVDGGCYYYQAADGGVYRSDGESAELIHSVPELDGASPRVSFFREDDVTYMRYSAGEEGERIFTVSDGEVYPYAGETRGGTVGETGLDSLSDIVSGLVYYSVKKGDKTMLGVNSDLPFDPERGRNVLYTLHRDSGGTRSVLVPGSFSGSLDINMSGDDWKMSIGRIGLSSYLASDRLDPDANVNFALLTEGWPYFTADYADDPFYYDGGGESVLLYVAEGSLVRVDLSDKPKNRYTE